jgi:predicted Fe-Mo cluster-binding NifX family protein
MRVVFPTNENQGYLSQRGAHFGKANYYTVITVEDEKITDVDGIKNPGHTEGGCGNAITNIMNLKPDALVVSGIGGAPAAGFEKAGLTVYRDQESATVQESVAKLLKGELATLGGQGTCSAH